MYPYLEPVDIIIKYTLLIMVTSLQNPIPAPPPQVICHPPINYTQIWGYTKWARSDATRAFNEALWDGTSIVGFNGFIKDGHELVGWKLSVRRGKIDSEDIQCRSAPTDGRPDGDYSTQCEICRRKIGVTFGGGENHQWTGGGYYQGMIR